MDGNSRSKGRDLNRRNSTDPEHDLRSPGLVHGAVAEDPDIALQEIGVLLEVRFQVWRPTLLLAVEHELDVDRNWNLKLVERFHRGEKGHDRPLVVGRGPAVESPLPVDIGVAPDERNDPGAVLDAAVAEVGSPRTGSPIVRDHGLPVVVSVEDGGPVSSCSSAFAEHHRGRTLHPQQANGQAPFLHEVRQMTGVAFHRGEIRRHVR
jgi:hypothetical protein